MLHSYCINSCKNPPVLSAFDSGTWENSQEVCLEHVCEGSTYVPTTRVKLLHDAKGIYGIFEVKDQYVKAVHCQDQQMVCRDSCVEFFLQPGGYGGYFNVEMNCGGSILCYYIRDAKIIDGHFADYEVLPLDVLTTIIRQSSLPPKIDPEIMVPCTWSLGFFIPFALLSLYGNDLSGSTWRGNFYKCGNQTSHPHWLCWHSVPNHTFHSPDYFGKIHIRKS